MRVETALNHYKRLDRRMADIFDRARSYSLTHAQILELRRKEVFEDPAWNKVPGWVRERIYARTSLRFDNLYQKPATQNEVAWYLLIRDDGTRIERWDDLTESEQELFRKNKTRGFHGWTRDGKRYSGE